MRDREVSPVELVRRAVARIERYPRLNAFRSLQVERALRAAREAERRVRSGEALGPLHGVPLAVKDNIDVLGAVTTAGTAFHDVGPARRNAAVVDCLVGAGAIVLGKLHLAEWAIGGTTHNVHFGDGRNPWDFRRSPGGSSGGSAAAVAAGLVPATIGTDTGSSLRIPAALTGTTTVRPTVGSVSTRGVLPVSWTLDTVGPIARSAADVAADLASITSFDAHDPSSRRAPPPERDDGSDLTPRIGVLPYEEVAAVDPGVRTAVDRAIETLVELGAIVEDVALQRLRNATESANTVLLAEAAAVHAARLH